MISRGPKTGPEKLWISLNISGRARIEGLGIIEGVIASQATGIIQQFIVIFDIFRPRHDLRGAGRAPPAGLCARQTRHSMIGNYDLVGF
jgi:hypothetical protein